MFQVKMSPTIINELNEIHGKPSQNQKYDSKLKNKSQLYKHDNSDIENVENLFKNEKKQKKDYLKEEVEMSQEYKKDFGLVQTHMIKDNFGIFLGNFSSPNSLQIANHQNPNNSLKK